MIRPPQRDPTAVGAPSTGIEDSNVVLWLEAPYVIPRAPLRRAGGPHLSRSSGEVELSYITTVVVDDPRAPPFVAELASEVVMTGVWVFEDGMVRRADSEAPAATGGRGGGKLLVHVPSSEVVTSYDVLERRLRELGWERYLNDPCLLQFHQRSTVHLISVPRDFSRLKLVHMYDIVVKTRNIFEVRDAAAAARS
ncbi:hypothetical protein GUJ93_ZPchr0004g38642 [Zizania palustris]|uniref:Flowering-promoting factor 1-like protein 3 n=1 Tax=Zizania palustris TaxID=103762 RepID=A0A8J5SXV8_ZIZPA|nr:hypothetical protein GUJ93_ZPchr0004g38642 [Zizania palustris]